MDLIPWRKKPLEERADPALSFNDWVSMFTFGSSTYPLQMGGTPSGNVENIEGSFQGFVNGAYKRNGIVFACMLTRQLLFSEARFQFRRMINGKPGDLFGTSALQLLEVPWTGGTTGDLLTRAILDVDLAGNFYAARRGDQLRRLRPDWVTIVLGSRTGLEIDTEPIGYSYQPGGPGSGEPPLNLLPEQVAHFAPIPDPIAKYRGMSWLGPIISEISSDQAATNHKRSFFDNGATLGYVVTLDKDVRKDEFDAWVRKFRAGHEGDYNAYRTLFLAGGADVKTVGVDFKQLDFKATQGAGETRICAAARIPPIIVGVSEGLASATYSNYGQARRAFADLTMRPLWRNMAASFANLVQIPGGAELWYDDRDIPFLQEDQKDAADIQQQQAVTIRNLVDAGFEPDSVIAAVMNNDYTHLLHSGLYSVQLQPAGAVKGNVLAGQVVPADALAPEPKTPPPAVSNGKP